MRIGVDGNEANVEKKVGVSVYTFEMLKYFAMHADAETQFVVYLRQKPLPHMPPASSHFKYIIVPGKTMWRDVFFPLHLITHRDCDVLFSPAHYTPRISPMPTIVTIHDLGYVHYPQDFLKKDLFKLENWTRVAVQQARKIIAVSDFTKKDTVEHYDIPEKKIVTIYNGFNVPESPSANVLRKGKYFLYVSTLQPRKNVTTLIEAFANFHKKHADYTLIIVGKKGWLYDEMFQKVEQLGLAESVEFTGYLPDTDVANLYTHSVAFVLPSFYEGFGMTILEAMHFGCPVIASSTGALPEIGGDACVYFDPHDTMDLQKRMEEIDSSQDLREKLVRLGKEHVKNFSWEKAGKETLAVLKNI